jgi:hypothetical protein
MTDANAQNLPLSDIDPFPFRMRKRSGHGYVMD